MMPMDLNPTNQKDLYERACRRMAELVPGWSDEIPSEPTVTILELASQLADLQNYKWNLVGPEHYLAYLKLLGGVRKELTPATLFAKALGGTIPYQGQRYWVDGVPYEVMEARRAEGEIKAVRVECGNTVLNWAPGETIVLQGDKIRLHIAFTKELPAEIPIRIWCGFIPEPGRIPPEPDTPPPIALSAQIPDTQGWRAITLQDDTCGFLQSGYLTVTAAIPFTSLCIEVIGQLEGTPCVQHMVLEPVRLEQRLTRSAFVDVSPPFRLPEGWAGNRVLRCFLPAEPDGWREAPDLYVQDGCISGWSGDIPEEIRVIAAEPDFPFAFSVQPTACEEVKLEEEGVLPERLKIMVLEDGAWYDCPITKPDPHHTLPFGCRWDEARNTLCFGDGRDYRIPTGGAILIAGCAVTLGSAGNGAAGILRQGDSTLLVLTPASGGGERESAQDAFRRTAKEQSNPLRAVTLADYEDLASKTPGLALGKIHAVGHQAQGQRKAGVTLLARPLSSAPLAVLTPWEQERLQEWLGRYRMLGVPVSVQAPRYLPLDVKVTLRVSEQIDEQMIRAAVVSLTDGVEGPLGFGAEISTTGITAALSGLEHVLSVTALEVRPMSGGVSRSQDGSIRLHADMLSYLKELQIKQI